MSQQYIILIDDNSKVHKFTSVDQFNKHLKEENDLRGGLGYDLIDCENSMVFVGEERCIEVHKGRASTQYKLSAAGCGCKKG